MVKLRVEDLHYTYRKKSVLDDISFSLEGGALLGIVGPNGCGKTTLIKCIDRILIPPQGKIFVDGRDMETMSRREIASEIAYVPQSVTARSSATVFEIVLLGRRPHMGWSVGEEDEEAVIDAMDRIGIGEFAFRRLHELSGGERQRVMIARALAQESPLLLLDEPTSSLDINHSMLVLEVLRSVAASQRISVAMAIHDINLALRYCDEILMLKDGHVRGHGPPTELITAEAVRDVYGIEAAVKDECGAPFIVPLSAARQRGLERP